MEYLYPNNISFPLGSPWVTAPDPVSPGLSSPPIGRGNSALPSSHGPRPARRCSEMKDQQNTPASNVPGTFLRAAGNLGAWSPRYSR